LEKIFPPSFFDVMEHLPIHLPDEAILGGPVQFRWMYPFERFFFHLKQKVKNKAAVEGSIVKQYLLEEITYFSTFYFEPHIQTKSRRYASKESVTGHLYEYDSCFGAIPDTFNQRGRVSGKSVDVWLSVEEYNHIHTYVLLNCDALREYERYMHILFHIILLI